MGIRIVRGSSRVRHTDPITSHHAAEDVRLRAGSQKHELLTAYRLHQLSGGFGLTDEEAAVHAGLDRPSVCWWKRCGELREVGYIEDTGETRVGRAGSERMICRITRAGIQALES